jgi:molybdate transport system substrate-binding protein
MRIVVKILLSVVMFMLIESVSAAPAPSKAVPVLIAWTSGALLPALQALAPEFERDHGLKLQFEVAPSTGKSADSVGRRLARKQPADIVVMNDFAMAKLQARGQIFTGSRVGLGKSFIAMAVRQGASPPDIRTEAAFRRALLAADSIGYTDSPSGLYLSRVLFVRMGLPDGFQRKTRMLAAGGMADAIASGRVQVGFAQFSELKPVPGIDIVGLIPDQMQQMTLYSAAVLKGSKQHDAAQGFLDYLASPQGREAIVASGLQPAH